MPEKSRKITENVWNLSKIECISKNQHFLRFKSLLKFNHLLKSNAIEFPGPIESYLVLIVKCKNLWLLLLFLRFYNFFPKGTHIAELFYDFRHVFDDVIDILVGSLTGDRETERAVCLLVGDSHRKKHVRGLK